MADVEAANAAGEIEKAIAVDVFDGGPVRAGGENRRGVRRAAGNGGFAAGHPCAGLGAGGFWANLNCFHSFLFSLLAANTIPPAVAAPECQDPLSKPIPQPFRPV